MLLLRLGWVGRRRPRLSLGEVASPQSLPPFHREMFHALTGAGHGRLVGEDDALRCGFVLLVVAPVGLEQDSVDLLEIDGFGLIAHSLDECADTEVFDSSQGAFGTAADEVDGVFGEGGVGKPGTVELGVDEVG